MSIFSTAKCLPKNHLNVFIFYEFRGKEGLVCEVYLDYREKKLGVFFSFLRNELKWKVGHILFQIITQHRCGYQHKLAIYSGL